MASDYRPDPDEILSGIKKTDAKSKRGKLKVFFGMCPGVGKTYAMLEAAHEKIAQGVNVLVGVVETHKRPETEKILEGLKILPKRKFDYKGTSVDEFDLDQALALKPDLILVDELAHTNASGAKHPKRYQDVKDLLFAGIDVYTTLNVQHVESRADLVYQISGVAVREKVPDVFLEYADQIELVDLSPEDLLRRLSDGKVYLGERAERAADNFFKEEKLTALRELALRFVAEVVDDHLRDHMQEKRILGPWNTNERLMVAVSHSPLSARLIRATRRMAFNLEAPWVALFVDTGSELSNEDHERLTKNLNLARELGAEVVTTKDHSVAQALTRVAAERNVTQIVMGRPDKRFFRDFFTRGNILDRLVNETSEVDIHVVRQKRKPIYRGFHIKLPKITSAPGIYLNTLAYVSVLSILGYALMGFIGYRAVGFIFLLGILPISTIAGGLGPTLLGAGLTALIWDFFFIPPQLTFSVSETEDAMMILAYFAVASVAGFLAARIKRQENDLLQRERRANILYSFGRDLADARTSEEVAAVGVSSIEAVFACKALVLKKQIEGKLSSTPIHQIDIKVSDKDFAVAMWAFDHHKKAGWRTETLSLSHCLCIPLQATESTIGVLMLYPLGNRSLSLDQENLIETIAAHLASALEKNALEARSRRAEVFEKSEKLHQALLNSVSHELRTPLTSILGGATALREESTIQNSTLRHRLVDDVVQSTERLNRTIENLMDMSRISSGVLKLKEDVFELNDFLQSVVQRSQRLFKDHELKLEFSDEDLFVKGDEKLLEHVVQNLLSNAAQYSPSKSKITIRTKKNQSFAEFSVMDEGNGLPESELSKVFDRFYRTPGSPPGGVGLGLSITKAILEAHHGAVFAANRKDKTGAEFTVLLPSHEVPQEVFQ